MAFGSCGTRDKPYIPPLRRHTGAESTLSDPAFGKVSAAKWRCGQERRHGFHCTLGSPGEHRAFFRVFSRPGRLHTRRTNHIGPKDAFDRRFESADKPRQDKKACFAPHRTAKQRRAPRCYPTVAASAGLAVLNTPFFARPRRGYIRTRKINPTFLCSLQWEVFKTPRDSITGVQIERGAAAPPPRAQIKQSGGAPNGPHRQTNAARAPSQNRLPEPRLTVRHEY